MKKNIKIIDAGNNFQNNKKNSRLMQFGVLFVALIVLLSTGAMGIVFNGNTNSISIADEGSLSVEWVNASDSDGLKLFDDGGNGITISDGGGVTVSHDTDFSGDVTLTSDSDLIVGGSSVQGIHNGNIVSVSSQSYSALELSTYHNTGYWSSYIDFFKARGSKASPTVVSDGDLIGDCTYRAYNGSAFVECGTIGFYVNQTNGDYVGGELRIKITDPADDTDEYIQYYADNSYVGDAVLKIHGTVDADGFNIGTGGSSKPRTGDMYFRTANSTLAVYDGSHWRYFDHN